MAKLRKRDRKRRVAALAQVSNDRQSTEEQELHAQILAAWVDEAYPGDAFIDGCNSGREACVAVVRYFTGRDWRDFDAKDLRKGCGAGWDTPIAFLSPSALRYFLPGLLLLFLAQHKALDVLGTHIVQTLCPHEGWRDKVRLLRPAQEEVVLAFLQYLVRWHETYGLSYQMAMLESGVGFWMGHVLRGRVGA